MLMMPKRKIRYRGEPIKKVVLIGQSLVVYADWATPVPIAEWRLVRDREEALRILEENGIKTENFKIIKGGCHE